MLWKFQCQFSMADPDLQIRGQGGGPPDPDPGLQKVFFRPFGPQFGLKIRGGGGRAPRAPPLDPPLVLSGGRETFLQFFARREEKMNSFRYKCPITAHQMLT